MKKRYIKLSTLVTLSNMAAFTAGASFALSIISATEGRAAFAVFFASQMITAGSCSVYFRFIASNR